MSENTKKLNSEEIVNLLNQLGTELANKNSIHEIAIFGGSALCLLFEFREATRDVDVMNLSGDIGKVIEIADKIAEKNHLGKGWLNDAIDIFKSDKPSYKLFGDFPIEKPGLRVFVAQPEYILAMKIMSMRCSLVTEDAHDVWNLLDELKITSTDEALGVFNSFYPDKELPVRNKLILDDLITEKLSGSPYSRMIARG